MGSVHTWGIQHKRFVVVASICAALLVLVSPFAVWIHAANAQSSGKPWYYSQVKHELQTQRVTHRQNAKNAANVSPNDASGDNGSDDNPAAAGAFAYASRAMPGTAIPRGALAAGQAQADQMQFRGDAFGWKQLGPLTLNNGNYFPEPVSGRLLSIAVDPQNSKVLYVGSAQGGIWKSTDGGKHWKALTDFQKSLAINSIAIDSKNPNIIFAGTGEDNLSCDAYHGQGILRSTDGGQSWQLLSTNTFEGSAIGNIALDPRFEGNANGEHLIVGAGFTGRSNSSTESCDGSLPANQQPQFGVFVSHDGGRSFTRTLNAVPTAGLPSFGTSDLAVSSQNPNIVYAAEQSVGIFKSTDAGQTWSNLDAVSTSGLPAPSSGFDRVQLAISPSNSNVLYAAYSNVVFLGAHMQAFKTTDGGATWTNLASVPDVCDGQCWYDMPVAVSPSDPNTVFIGGNANYDYIFNLFGQAPSPDRAACATIAALSNLPAQCNASLVKSTDGGKTWQDIELGTVQTSGGSAGFPAGVNTLHPDSHAVAFDPQHPNVMYEGNDGGLYVTTDGGKTWGDLNPGLGTLQFQAISVSPNGQIIGGTQDNGTEQFTPKTGTTWTNIDGGDGGLTQIDPTNPSTLYHTYAGVSLVRSDDNGKTFNEIDFPLLSDASSFYPAFALAQSQPNTLYYGTYRIWRTDDKGGPAADFGNGHWTAISPDLTGTNGACNFNCITAVAVSPVNPNVVVVGTGGGLLWQSTNADAANPTWTQITAKNTPNRFITQVVFAPKSQTTVYVTYSGFNSNPQSSAPGHVFTSTTIGSATPTFRNIDGTISGLKLPDLPTNTIAVDPRFPSAIAVGSDYGVFASLDNGHTWFRIDGNLPHSEVYYLAYNNTNNSLVVATHGRGVWELRLP